MDERRYPKMDRKVKTRWVKALRSGKYEQGQNALVVIAFDNTDHFCCLGVYCEISTRVKRDREEYIYNGDHVTTALPVELRDKIGLDSFAQDKLITMNDGEHRSFAEIADWIDANL
jgi:hypothetical protein